MARPKTKTDAEICIPRTYRYPRAMLERLDALAAARGEASSVLARKALGAFVARFEKARARKGA